MTPQYEILLSRVRYAMSRNKPVVVRESEIRFFAENMGIDNPGSLVIREHEMRESARNGTAVLFGHPVVLGEWGGRV